MEPMEWTCDRCGHQVPIANRQVHRARCDRSRRPPPTSPSPSPSPSPSLPPFPSPSSSPSLPGDPESGRPPSPNAFAPGGVSRPSQLPSPVAPMAPAEPLWREVHIPGVVERLGECDRLTRERGRRRRENGRVLGNEGVRERPPAPSMEDVMRQREIEAQSRARERGVGGQGASGRRQERPSGLRPGEESLAGEEGQRRGWSGASAQALPGGNGGTGRGGVSGATEAAPAPAAVRAPVRRSSRSGTARGSNPTRVTAFGPEAARRGRGGGGGGIGGAGGASAAAATGGGGGGGGQAEWACQACTFLNDRRSSRCGMCGTRMPPEERPPDGTYRDTLIGDNGPGDYGLRSQSQSQRLRRRRPAGAEGGMAAAAEAAMCELSGRHGGGGGVTIRGGDGRFVATRGGARGGLSGGASGGGVDDGNDGSHDGGSAVSDAAAGSALGALGAGVLSAMTPGARPGRVLASMMQGAIVGGVAGAALGTGFRLDSRGGGGGGGGGGDAAFDERDRREGLRRFGEPGGRRTHVATNLGNPETQWGMARDLEWMLLTQNMREMGLSNEAAAEIMEGMAGVAREEQAGGGDARPASASADARPASAAAITALPQETLGADWLSRMTGDEDARQCCICLDEFGVGEVVTRLPCLHLYHAACIKQWLHTSGTCPQCKHRVD